MGKLGVVIVAAGRGSRMGSAESKQYLWLKDKPILIHTLMAFESMDFIDGIWLVVGQHDKERCREWIASYDCQKVKHIISGGNERQHSVYRGISTISSEYEWVMIHDGVRPFVTEDMAISCLHQAKRYGSAVAAVPVKDTVKIVDEAGLIRSTPDRRSLWAVQTPQAFRLDQLKEAHEAAQRDGVIGTDDAMLLERLGAKVAVSSGDYANIKITTPEDLLIAERYLEEKERSGT